MKVQFYILGLLLRYGPQHGYRLKQKVEEGISDFAQIKLPTIYYHLDKMKENGYVSASSEKDQNRPEKTVYSITENGEKYFYTLQKKMEVEELNFEFSLDGIIYFHERIDMDEYSLVIKNTRRRVEAELGRIEARRDSTLCVIPREDRTSASAIFNHHIYHLKAELEWLKEQEKEIGN